MDIDATRRDAAEIPSAIVQPRGRIGRQPLERRNPDIADGERPEASIRAKAQGKAKDLRAVIGKRRLHDSDIICDVPNEPLAAVPTDNHPFLF